MIVKVLTGHTTQATAYVIEDYPYSFRLRCKKRVWLERDAKKGYRLCAQTSNPKKSMGHMTVWNAPKKSTYSMFAVMGLDEQGHVVWEGCSIYDHDKLEEFGKKYAEGFDADQVKDHDLMVRAYRAYQARKAAAEASK